MWACMWACMFIILPDTSAASRINEEWAAAPGGLWPQSSDTRTHAHTDSLLLCTSMKYARASSAQAAPTKNKEALQRSLQLLSKLNYSTQLMLAKPPSFIFACILPLSLTLTLSHFQSLLFSPWILLLTISIKGNDLLSVRIKQLARS